MKREILDRLLAARAERKAVALVTQLDSGAQRIVARGEAAKDALADVLEEAFRFDQSGVHEGLNCRRELFLAIHMASVLMQLIYMKRLFSP